jgi:hypothetical protein
LSGFEGFEPKRDCFIMLWAQTSTECLIPSLALDR